jgi:hypothetical protein
VAVVGETEGEDLEEEGGITGIDSNIATSSNRIHSSSNSNSRISSKIKVVSLSLHSLMALFMVGCLLLGLSKVLILNFLHNNLGINPTNG